ncbi:putative calcium-binding protein CML30 [Apostasia shenzhenica]|uniref:Putative calcium-binding protein CML30 n=1 Tax=Apostasia shenzhenica TaxID=1088818 RepID=A0A2I0A7E3_9ASPA|nr:putative calcium-binding protein CML30 [Apostasia shenzhenica]
MEATAALVLFALLFLCALLNSLLFPPSKLLPRLRSLFLSALSPAPLINDKRPKAAPLPADAPDDSADLRSVFSTFDSDGDGFISAGELADSLRRLGLHAGGGEIRAVMEKADANGDGLIDLDEFRQIYESWGSAGSGDGEDGDQEDRDLREAFAVFDGNGDGVITVEELGLVLKSLGLMKSSEACRDMIQMVDLDGDGMVNFDEFKKMMVIKGGKIF